MVVMGKIITDSIPNEVMQKYSLVTNIGISFGILYVGLIQAIILPLKEDGKEALLANETWRIIWGYPIINQIFFSILIAIFYKNPSLQDEINRENYDEAQ